MLYRTAQFTSYVKEEQAICESERYSARLAQTISKCRRHFEMVCAVRKLQIKIMRLFREKYRGERSSELAAACNITASAVSIVFYDIVMSRRYARAVSVGSDGARSASEELAELFNSSCEVFGIPSSSVKCVGIAAPFAVESGMELMRVAEELGLLADTEIFFVPFISARLGGSFTASLLTLPEGECIAADFGRTLSVARIKGGEIDCAAFELLGAFDGSGLESSMPAERGAIDAVRREKDGTIVYEVMGDTSSVGISPCAAAMAAVIMRRIGVLDNDGIMTDRDLFYIGEDFFVSQADIRVIQSDKAMAAAALELFSGDTDRTFFSGEVFSGAAGLRALIELGAVPKRLFGVAFCRDSAEQGIILCIESRDMLNRAREIVQNARDITEELLPKLDELYLGNLEF